MIQHHHHYTIQYLDVTCATFALYIVALALGHPNRDSCSIAFWIAYFMYVLKFSALCMSLATLRVATTTTWIRGQLYVFSITQTLSFSLDAIYFYTCNSNLYLAMLLFNVSTLALFSLSIVYIIHRQSSDEHAAVSDLPS